MRLHKAADVCQRILLWSLYVMVPAALLFFVGIIGYALWELSPWATIPFAVLVVCISIVLADDWRSGNVYW